LAAASRCLTCRLDRRAGARNRALLRSGALAARDRPPG
jgi:hypothetical protein